MSESEKTHTEGNCGYRDHFQCRMSTVEVMTAASFFGGGHKKSYDFPKEYGCISHMLSKSRFSRRLARIPELFWRGLAAWLASVAHRMNSSKIYISDSFFIPVFWNIRIKRCEIYQNESFRGYIPSLKQYFYGLKVHTLMTKSGIHVKVFLFGLHADVNAIYDFCFPIDAGNIIYRDREYTRMQLKMSLIGQTSPQILS